MKKISGGILFFFVVCALSAQVKIVDKNTLFPIEGVKVMALKSQKIIYSDAAGMVDLSSIPDKDTLLISFVGYEKIKILSEEAKSKKKIYLDNLVVPLNEVVISASKFKENREDVPQLNRVISRSTIQEIIPQTSGELLEATGAAFVQQSQYGGGSPVLRGFEANRVMLVIDGIRMNNAIYRSGHLQNVITIDPEMLDRVEVLYGPGSVMYGSDAMGGVMSFYTPNLIFSTNNKLEVHGKAITKYATSAAETFNAIGLHVGSKRIASYAHLTYKNLGDLRSGNIRNPAYGDFGKCLYYAQRINGKDSMLVNDNPNIQRNSGYWQMDALEKIAFKINDRGQLMANVQYSTSSDVPRYDRLTQMSGNTLTYAEWKYGHQNRFLAALSYEAQKLGFADNAKITASYQDIDEERITRKFNKTSRRYQKEDVGVMALNADFDKQIKSHELRYGLEIRNDEVKSTAYNENINTGAITYDAVSRYPEDYNKMLHAGAYLSHAWEANEHWILTQGLRYQYVALHSAWTDTMMNLAGFPFDKTIEQKNGALSGAIGAVLKLKGGWAFHLNLASGFRAPNVDDVGKVNDSKPNDHLLIVPSPDLKPEYAYSAEFTIRNSKENEWNIENTVFYTYLDNTIILQPTTWNGQDSIMFGGRMCQIQANTNAGHAYILGNQFGLQVRLNERVSAKSYLTYTYGRVEKDTPLDHIPPTFGLTEISYKYKWLTGFFYVRYSAWKRLKDYSPTGEDNLEYATPWGMPGWNTLNAKVMLNLSPNLTITAALENILDVHYRKFASGISSPGRNLIVSFRAKF